MIKSGLKEMDRAKVECRRLLGCKMGKPVDIQDHGRGKVLETVVKIQDHGDAAKEIETSLLEFHVVLLDMAVMVEAQREKTDDIDHHVMNAAHYGTKNPRPL